MIWEFESKNSIFHVKVSRKTAESNFYTSVDKLCVFKDGPDFIMDKVMVHEADPEYCPNTINKTYSIYLSRENLDIAKNDGIEAIKEYRRIVEGIS